MKKIFRSLIVIIIAVIMACLIAFPEKYVSSTKKGIELWAINGLPSLFPFFFLSLLLTKLNVVSNLITPLQPLMEKNFRCNGVSGYVFIMSILSGYPVGARLICELYENNIISPTLERLNGDTV